MALFVRQSDQRSELQERVASDVRARMQERIKLEGDAAKSGRIDHSSPSSAQWVMIAVIALILVAAMVTLLIFI